MKVLFFNLYFIFVTLFTVTSILNSANAAETIPTKFSKKENIPYTFIQMSNKAIIKEVNVREKKYQLILKDFPNHISYLSDRPYRYTGYFSIDKFFTQWNHSANSFKLSPPNVSISGTLTKNGKSTEVNFIVVLNNPIYNLKEKTISYDMNFVSADAMTIQNKLVLSYVTLFIDAGVCPSCCC